MPWRLHEIAIVVMCFALVGWLVWKVMQPEPLPYVPQPPGYVHTEAPGRR